MKTLVQGLRYSLAALAMIFAAQAQAILLQPGDENELWSGEFKGAMDVGDVAERLGKLGISSPSDTFERFYKADYEGAHENDDRFSGSYDTTFWGEPNHATIVFTGGTSIVCPECYLVVKSGKKWPHYLFDIGDWDGTDTIELKDFYKDRKGDISHIAIFGKSMVNVPEPGALILIGLGMIGLGLARRRVAR